MLVGVGISTSAELTSLSKGWDLRKGEVISFGRVKIRVIKEEIRVYDGIRY